MQEAKSQRRQTYAARHGEHPHETGPQEGGSAPMPAAHPGHHALEHFPSLEEDRLIRAALGPAELIDPDEIASRLERLFTASPDMFMPAPPSEPLADSQTLAPNVIAAALAPSVVARKNIAVQLSPWILALLRALSRPRLDQRLLDPTARQRLNQAIQTAVGDGSYGQLAAIHGDMSHRMHSSTGAVGTQRFLPWHRIYLFKCEQLLRSKVAGVTVPYWNYSVDGVRPDWVYQPPNVVRNAPNTTYSLPTQATIDNLVNNVSSYTSFSTGLEYNAHNSVHNWCNGTITSPPTAARDPIFFLLHANVDRIWDLWQQTHGGTPSLAGADTIMDPWSETAADANDVIKLGYVYQ